MENNNLAENEIDPSFSEKREGEEEYTPKLFSDENNHQSEEMTSEIDDQENNDSGQLFEQDINEEEDFEIPAFLRKQQF